MNKSIVIAGVIVALAIMADGALDRRSVGFDNCVAKWRIVQPQMEEDKIRMACAAREIQ